MRVKLWAIFVGLAILAWGAAPSAAESGAVHGVVRENAAGSRMPGVRVVAIPEALKPGALLPQGVTSQEGAFEIRGVEPGRYRLVYHVDALGWSEEKDTVTVEEGRTAHVECEIDLAQVTGTLAARVVVESDEPLSGRAIVSMAGPLAGQIQRTAPVERDGSFRLGGLPAGRYSVQATVGGRLASTTAEVAIGQEAVVELRLAEENSAVYEGSNITLSAATVSGRGSARSMAASWLVLPEDGIELGTSLSFLFAPGASGGAQMPGMAGARLRFTDVVLWSAGARYSINGRLELHGGALLLPKQPVSADESVWQGASGGARLAIGRHFAADLELAGGPLLAGAGYLGEVQATARGKATVDEWSSISFEGALGGSASNLFLDDTGDAWFSEALAAANILLHTPRGEFGGWVGFELRFPLADGAGDMGPALDPQTRANFRVGTVYSVARSWDLWVELAVIDRGDASEPATMLPVLSGGFDQRQLVFGVVRRFDLEDEARMMIAVPGY
ncbi:MAG TPA: carboxypeptidase-like regulatory domain-containing protein [Kofleriaceae bacterium]|nr:carboxypeptidase-like regulatory domain-containing protein [Kofleriaceae bacterium]